MCNVFYKRVGHISEWATFPRDALPLPQTPIFSST